MRIPDDQRHCQRCWRPGIPSTGPHPPWTKGLTPDLRGAAIHLDKCKDWVVFNMLTACTEQQCNVIIHPTNYRLFYFYRAKFPPQSLFEVGPLTLFALTDTFGPKRQTISSLTTISIKDEDQWELGKIITLGNRQQVRFLRVRQQRWVRDRLDQYRVIRQERNTRELCTSQRTIWQLAGVKLWPATEILWLIAGEWDTGVTDCWVRLGW